MLFDKDQFQIPEYIKPLTKQCFDIFGVKPENVKKEVATIEEMRGSIQNIVIGSAKHDLKFQQLDGRNQILQKNHKYVMSISLFQQLWSYYKFKNLTPSKIRFMNVYRPYTGQDLTNKTLLVNRTGGIGDLLFIQPNLYHLKEKYPSCKIIFACGPQYQPMVKEWSCVDQVIDLPFDFNYLLLSHYHAVFEGVIERCTEAKTVNCYNLFSRWLGIDLPDELLMPRQTPRQDRVEDCKKILKEWGIKEKDFILMQLTSSSPVRTPHPNKLEELVDKLTIDGKYKVVISDSPSKDKIVDLFISKLRNSDNVFNFSKHSKTLDYNVAMTSLSKMTISPDSALVHIAASLGVKTFGIYGPFPGYIRLKTYGNLASWIDCKYSCAPCFVHSSRPCSNNFEGHGICFNSLDCDEVLQKVKELENV